MESNDSYDGNPTHEVERYERGLAEKAYWQREFLRSFGDHLLDSIDSWEKSARIALRPFSPLGRGEQISDKEIKQRLSDIKYKGGYDVPAYSHMNREEAWNSLQNIQRGLLKGLEFYFPEVLAEINETSKRRYH